MKKVTTIHTRHQSWALYGKMSSQCNHKSSPNNVVVVVNSFCLLCSPFYLILTGKIIAKFSAATVLPFFFFKLNKAIRLYTYSKITLLLSVIMKEPLQLHLPPSKSRKSDPTMREYNRSKEVHSRRSFLEQQVVPPENVLFSSLN